MKRTYPQLLAFLALLLLPIAAAMGQSNYYFSYTTSDPITLTSPSTLFTGATTDGNTRYTISTSFVYRFNGLTYNTLTLSSNGVVFPSSSSLMDSANSFTVPPRYPFIAPFWDDLFMTTAADAPACNPAATPAIRYQIIGTTPNRVLVIEWKDIKLRSQALTVNNKPLGHFQMRLYEINSKIEFWYGLMSPCDLCGGGGQCYTTSASVGIAASASQFISVSFPDGVPTANRVTPNDNVNINPSTGGTRILPNTTLVFGECMTMLTGRTGEDNGGTVNLNNGDTFFNGFTKQVGQSAVYRPMEISMSSTLCTAPYTLTITGSAAADYYFGTPGTQSITRTLDLGGNAHIPEITFRPTLTGTRSATLTLTGQGVTRTFNLSAAAPFVSYSSNVSQGGTPDMKSGDILMGSIRQHRNTTSTYSPFTLTNASTASRAITFNLTGGNGQYSITPGTTLAPGASITPVITFNATGFGIQNATLEINAGGQIRTFPIRAISSAPGVEFRMSSGMLDTTSKLFVNSYTCLGSEIQSVAVEVENIGFEPFTIQSAEFYQVDTAFQQGIPRYPLLRNGQGDPILLTRDYIVTREPLTAPYRGHVPNAFPVTLGENEKMTFYISFTGSNTGKRFARGYLITNAENIAAPNTLGVLKEGIVFFDLYGRGNATQLAGDLSGKHPQTVLFPSTRLTESAQSTLHLANPGTCSLRISMPQLQITTGDVNEFSIVTPPTGFIDTNTQDLVLAPGESTQMTFRFTPARTGSRRASLRLVTNDSLANTPNHTEPGVYHVDLYGVGGTDLYLDAITFGEVVIGADASEQPRDVVRVVNAMEIPFTVNTIAIEGPDASEFKEDPARPWPTTPRLMQPGEEIELGIIFAPAAGGVTGERNAIVKLTTTLPNSSSIAQLKGTAGMRTMDMTPASITFTPMTTGKQQRRRVTITNTGSMKIKINQPEVTGPDAQSFHVSTMERLELSPGQTEYLEVTFMPLQPGIVAATLNVTGNASNAPQQVLLDGTAFMKGPDGNDGNTPVINIEDGVGRTPDMAVSGVETQSTASGVTLYQSIPNPASEIVEISYHLQKSGTVELALYDAQGRLVQMLDEGTRTAGTHGVRANINALAAGMYHYRLTTGGTTLARVLHIVR